MIRKLFLRQFHFWTGSCMQLYCNGLFASLWFILCFHSESSLLLLLSLCSSVTLVFFIIHWAHTVQVSSLRSLLMFRYNHDWCTKIIPKKWSMEWKDMMTRFSGSIVCDRFIRWWRLRKLHQTIIRPIPPTSTAPGENALRGLDETTLADSLWCALNFKGAHDFVLGCNTFAFEWIAPTQRKGGSDQWSLKGASQSQNVAQLTKNVAQLPITS